METSFQYTDRDKAWFSSDERKFITKVRTLKEKYPDRVQILAEPEDNDGCIYCTLPSDWLSVRPPKKMNLTDEQRAAIGNRLRGFKRECSSLPTVLMKLASNSSSSGADE